MEGGRDEEPKKMVDKVKSLLADRPFVPFVLCVSDGTAFFVSHPEAAVATKGGIEIAKKGSAGGYSFCSWLHVAHLDVAGNDSPEQPESGQAKK